MSLSDDLITEVLGRVDGITLAHAACASSDFRSIAAEESLWGKACCSLWPSTAQKDVKEFISSSLGGFRKFYANCFPSIAYDLEKLNDVGVDLHAAVPSEFVWVVDVYYNNAVIYSDVFWGFHGADDFPGSGFKSRFRIDLIDISELEDDDHTVVEELPAIMCVEKQRNEDEFLGDLMENIRLSWIVVNKRIGRAANLSSWKPLAGQKNWPLEKEYILRFGSILPTHHILPCKAVECVIEIKFRALDGDSTTIKIIELSMRMEDMMGAHLRQSKSLVILQNALGCRKRSRKHIQILKSHERYEREKRKLVEAKMRKEAFLNAVHNISGVVALAFALYLILKEYGAPLFF